MRIFYSVGEPSGDIHGTNLIRALDQIRPGIEHVGFGGERMADAGCKQLFPLTQLAVMGIWNVLGALPQFLSLLSQADRYFAHHRPDAVVLIDFPGFNWWIARRARFHGIPVFYFVPPQLWAWAGWRVSKMRRFVDHVLCSLPFEPAWYAERGVSAQYIGHPFYDELPKQQLDAEFLDGQRRQGGTIIGILPGSRTMEVERNLPTQLRAAERIHREHPHTRFLIASFKESQRKMAEEMRRQFPALPVEMFVGKTPEIITLSKACISVSGSVSLELLYAAKPTVVVYRLSKTTYRWLRPLLKAKYITLVNLLADKMLYPEFATDRCDAEKVAQSISHWLSDERAYADVCRELLTLREKTARPGACAAAGQRIMEVLDGESSLARRAA